MVFEKIREKFKDEVTKTGNYKIPNDLPLIPVKDTIVFPYTVTPLTIQEDRSIAAVDSSMASDRLIVTAGIKNLEREEVSIQDLYEIGTVAVIHKMLRIPEKSMILILQGIAKVKIKEFTSIEPFLKARIEVISEREEKTERVEALMRNALAQTQKLISLAPYIPDEIQVAALNIDKPNHLAYFLTTILKMKIPELQELLELEDPEEKLKRVLTKLDRELELLELGGKIQSQVQSEIAKSQKEYYLREQLKAIQQELGETDERVQEANELREKVRQANLPEEVAKEAEKEIKRLERLPPQAAEYTVIRTYLDWIIELPWNRGTEDNLNTERARQILDEDHYDLEEVKERMIEFLAVRHLKKEKKGPILCFVGPPGVGKTSLGQSIARALGRKFIRMSLGGIRDEAEIRGHRRTYVGALPGRILQSMRRIGSNNPVFMLDEVDKIGADFRGDPAAALLEVLDPEQNNAFRDHYIELPFDLSNVMFITTANIIQTIHPALRDRMEVLRLAGYTEEEKLGIAERYLIPRQLKEHGLDRERINFTPEAIRKIISGYTKEAGVRNLEREIARVCRKVAKKVVDGKAEKFTITERNLPQFLGPEKEFPEVARRTSIPGVATGLAWTEAGGDILFIEATKMPGRKTLTLTGQLGEVMQESAKAALSYIRSKAKDIGIDSKFFDKYDLHLHVPAGAIPKVVTSQKESSSPPSLLVELRRRASLPS